MTAHNHFIILFSWLRTATSICIVASLALCSTGSSVFCASLQPIQAINSDSQAIYEIGLKLCTDDSAVAKDYSKAAIWFERAAQLGHPKAQYRLALRYILGQGVEKNYSEAFKWLKKSAEQGESDAQYSLGLRFLWGQGVEKNGTEAEKWFIQAAQNGHKEAALHLQKNTSQTGVTITPRAVKRDVRKRLSKAEKEDSVAKYIAPKTIRLLIPTKFKQKPESKLNIAVTQSALTASDYFLKGNSFLSQGKPGLAIKEYQKSLAINPNSTNLYNNLAIAYVRNDDFGEAIKVTKKLVTMKPDVEYFHVMLGSLYQKDGANNKALSEYITAAKLNPGHALVYRKLAEIYEIQDKKLLASQCQYLAKALSNSDSSVDISSKDHSILPKNPKLEIHLRQIVLNTKIKAEEILEKLHNNKESFSKIALNNAVSPFHLNGGYLGFFGEGELSPEVDKVTKNLPILAFSQIVKTKHGYHIFQKIPVMSELLYPNDDVASLQN